MGPLRFELRLPTPQAGRIPGYPTVPGLRKGEYLVYKIDMRDNHSSTAVSLYIEIVKNFLYLFRLGFSLLLPDLVDLISKLPVV